MDNNIIVGKNYRFTVLSDILIRLEFSETGEFVDDLTELVRNRKFTIPKFTKQEDDNYLVIETDYFKLDYIKNKSFVGSKFVPEANLKVILKGTDKYWFYNHAEARNFYTIGSSLDNKNNIIFNGKSLYSTDGFVSIDDSKSLLLKDNIFYNRNNKNIDIYLFMYKRDFGKVIRDYIILTGKPNMIPRYMFGNIWNKTELYTDQNIKDLVSKFNINNIPISNIILNKWNKVGSINSLEWNNDLFINYDSFYKFFKENNINLGLKINGSIISNYDSFYNDLKTICNIENDNEFNLNIYDKNITDNYFNKCILPLKNNGVNNFIIDYYGDNKYLGVLKYYFKLNNINIMGRNTLINEHLNDILYTGNSIVSWDILKKMPEYISSGFNKCLCFISCDILGYSGGIEDDELYRRSIQFGTFSPILRLSSDEGKYYKREPWKWDNNTLTIVKDYLRLRHMLIPYLYTEAKKYCETGLSFIKPLYFSYPSIYDEIDYRNEYYFGSNLVICPIVKKKDSIMNRTIQRIFLPDGIWYDFKNGIKFNGNKRYVTFYKDEDYPIFATQGSIIPLAKIDDNNINSVDNPLSFIIHIFPGKSNTYTIYEDDKNNLNNYFKTIIDYNYMLNNYTVIIRNECNSNSIVPSIRNYEIIFRNTRHPNQIKIYVGEDIVNDYEEKVENNDFIIKLNNVNSLKQISINCTGQDIEIDNERILNQDIDSIISDLKIETKLKYDISNIIFSDLELKKKRVEIRKLKRKGLSERHVVMFLKLLDYLDNSQL